MDLRVLRYYLTVCQEKNISKAAASLHIAQPSLSKQIKELEDELGVTLFIRGHRQITLTQEGYFLRDRAQEMGFKNLGIDTLHGYAKFVDNHNVEVNGE